MNPEAQKIAASLGLSPEFCARYQLRAMIGRGGMGAVYRAQQAGTGREVAIKFMAGSLFEGDDAEARFLNEARTLAALHHENLVLVLEAGRDGETPYIVFEYVKGVDLKGHLRDKDRLDVYEALTIASHILRGLKVAHEKGVVHRDIKSENILLDAQGRVKVADFGVAKSDSGNQTKTGVIVGTPAYMAPEQAMGKKLDPRTDVYSVGVVLFEMITGRLPFGEDNSMATMMAHINEPVPAPSFLIPHLPGLLDDLLAGALAKAPEDRYPSARAFEIAIERGIERLRRGGFEDRPPTAAEAAAAASTPAPTGGATRAMHLGESSASLDLQALQGPRSGTVAANTAELAQLRAGAPEPAADLAPTGGATRATMGGFEGLAATGGRTGAKSLAGTAPRPAPSVASRALTAAAPPAHDPRQRGVMIAGGAVVLLVGGIVLGSLLGGGEEADPGAPPEVQARIEGYLERATDLGTEVSQVRFLLLEVPRELPPEARGLRTETLDRLRRFREEQVTDEERDLAVLLGLCALGDEGSYGFLAEVLEGRSAKDQKAGFVALEQGLRRGFRPPEEAERDLAEALWALSPDMRGRSEVAGAFFRTVAALGDRYSVLRLKDILAKGERQAVSAEAGEGARQALQRIAEGETSGGEPARDVLAETAQGGAGALDLSDDEALDAVRGTLDQYKDI